jgi:soluble lytic murein transglycosylase
MSSMVRMSLAAFAVFPLLAGSASLQAQDARQWDQARASLVASQPGEMARAVAIWEQLTANPRLSFGDYASFVLTWPGMPDEAKIRGYAEGQLVSEFVEAGQLVAFFDRFPPVTNPARAQYAMALAGLERPEALETGRAAWRGGAMNEIAEVTLLSLFGPQFTQDDHDARMNALLWDRESAAGARHIVRTSPDQRATFMARLAASQGEDPLAGGLIPGPGADADPGYLYNRTRQLRRAGRDSEAVRLLSSHPPLALQPLDQTAWVTELLTVARLAGPSDAIAIAARAEQAFAPGEDISRRGYRLRDDYTSLMWLGGTRALWSLGDGASAAPLFYRYGAAAQTPQTRSKGFYWAALASQRAGDGTGAQRYFEMAAAYPDRFYGMLALDRLGRPMPSFTGQPAVQPTAEERAAFMGRPITAAVREVARGAPWRVGIRFYREIADQAETEADHVLVAELARDLGRRDLAVILGEAAAAHGLESFREIAFPTLVAPAGTDWTMVHAITRQESQFAENAVSHAGATGLMQLMPGTAREQAGKLGLSYLSSSLITDPAYNIRLGSGYFGRMLDYYGGSYPLAVAAYNAGPGNVNKWVRANGDPRNGSIGWVEWIERIPIYETKNYVQRVLENAVVYEAMHPGDATHRHPHTIDEFLTINLDG